MSVMLAPFRFDPPAPSDAIPDHGALQALGSTSSRSQYLDPNGD